MVRLAEELKGKVEGVMRQRGVIRASVFGSVARGEETPQSDVDFLVEFEEGRTLLDLVGLRLDLCDVLERDVDVATPNSLHPRMRDQVFSELLEIL
jgi:predicted nucleotidyltransferase